MQLDVDLNVFGGQKKKRAYVTKEWKKALGNRCKICGKDEKQVGEIQWAHLKAQSKGGKAIIPLCPNHHRKYDKGKLTPKELKKLGISGSEYKRFQPKKKKKRIDDSDRNPFGILEN